jgi:hypothetical protein
MYGFVPYNLSPIQQGIQFGHAVQEYNNLMMALSTEVKAAERAAFDAWRKCDKTFIILNGGTTNSNPERIGTLNKSLIELTDAGVLCASFREPDLGDQLTAFVFIVDDRVFDREEFPDYTIPYEELEAYKQAGKDFSKLPSYISWKTQFGRDANTIIFLRDYLRNFKLA